MDARADEGLSDGTPSRGRRRRRAGRVAAVFLASLALSLWAGDVLERRWSPRPRGLETASIGPASAPHRLVYLHGLDTRWPSWTEIQNREVLRTIASALDARIALPRSPAGAWPRGSEDELRRSADWIAEAARASFGDTPDYAVLGFSDGGYLTGDLFVRGWLPGGVGCILVGGGAWRRPGVADLSGFGRIVLLAGRSDPGALEGLGQVATLLRSRRARVSIVEYAGGHRLPLDATCRELAGLWGARGAP